MKTRLVFLLLAAALFAGCRNAAQSPPAAITRAPVKPATLAIPATEQRAALRAAYRLRPDDRFLLAVGEIRRLAAGKPVPPSAPAQARFADGRWSVRLNDAELGTLPELPDFPDYLKLLVQYAGSSLPKKATSHPAASAGADAFLMPAVLGPLSSAEASGSIPDAARYFSRIAFQMEDRLAVAPLVPARALALLAAARSRDPHAAIEEEILLAESLGYTAHAEALAKSLPKDSPLRLFEAREDDALARIASRPGSSELSRYLSLRRAADSGDLSGWKEARTRLFPGDTSATIVSTGLELALPQQVEAEEKNSLLAEAIPSAVLRELHGASSDDSPAPFEDAVSTAASAAHGPFWDGSALHAYYDAIFLSSAAIGHWPTEAMTGTAGKIAEILNDDPKRASDKVSATDGTGAPLVIDRIQRRLRNQNIPEPEIAKSIRGLVLRLDSRPSHRAELAFLLHYYLLDTRAAEDLHRSLVTVLGDGRPDVKAKSALYVGDWTTLERLAASPHIKAAQAASILWTWYGSNSEPDRLERQFALLTDRFPADWNCTNEAVEFLRSRRKYRQACEVGEKWLSRNRDPRTPGQFHAHIRLAHSYVLAHEYANCRMLLEGMTDSEPFQRMIRSRGMAECLTGLGKLPEAESRIREVFRWESRDWENVRVLVGVLWAEGKDQEAAQRLADAANVMPSADVCRILSILPDQFLNLPPERLTSAVDAIAKKPELFLYYRCAGGAFAAVERWDDAFRVASLFPETGDHRMDQLIMLYEYRVKSKGREDAGKWLKQQIPVGHLNPLSMKALYSKDDDLLWDVIVVAEPNNHPEWVWLYRADALALRGADDDGSRRARLLDYFGKDDPDLTRKMGRYLLGLATEQELLALATTPERLSSVAYSMGVRAQSEKRFRDANEWYHVSMETQQRTSERTLASYALTDWVRGGQGIGRVEREAAAAVPSTIGAKASKPGS